MYLADCVLAVIGFFMMKKGPKYTHSVVVIILTLVAGSVLFTTALCHLLKI